MKLEGLASVFQPQTSFRRMLIDAWNEAFHLTSRTALCNLLDSLNKATRSR